jgi:type VI secretion system protein ImpA
MPLRDDLLKPIAGQNPSGLDLRYDTELLLYDKITEARRQDDDLTQGDWQHERKVADNRLVIELTQDALAAKTKDLKLAVWLTDALLRTEGFAGLRQGLTLCRGLVDQFWDTLYPPIEEGDTELRAAPLDWLGSALEIPLKSRPLVRAGHGYLVYKDSRLVGYENQVQGDKEKKLRQQRISEGKLTPEEFDKAFVDTPKAFYLQSEKDLDSCLAELSSLDKLCRAKFGDSGPSFGGLRTALEEVRQTVHILLQKKRETEPDPVEETPVEGDAASGDESAGTGGRRAASPAIVISIANSSEPQDRKEVIESIARAAAYLRKREPFSPAPYLMMRGLRWGELRAAAQISDAALLEGPPSELRQHIKRLSLAQKWAELLETAENAMALPCSRAWLDLQRHVVQACAALGSDYAPIAAAISLELKVLIHDLPQLLDATLLDDSPVANSETRAWIASLMQPSASAGASPSTDAPQTEATAAASTNHSRGAEPSWPSKPADSFDLAKDALKAGQMDKAFDIMRHEIAAQNSGRDRFYRTLQLVKLCVEAGKDGIAQPYLEDLVSSIEAHKLDDWEVPAFVAEALATVMTVSKKVQGNAAERQKLFERICRLDPVRALKTG